MNIEPIGALTLLVGILGLFFEPSFIVYAFFGSTLLGAGAAIILVSLDGVTIQPAALLLGFLTIKLLSVPHIRTGIVRAVSIGSPGFWLVLTVVYAAISAYVMPRLFQGLTLTVPVRAARGHYDPAQLLPTTSNLTQSVYFFADCICFLMLSGLGRSEVGRRSMQRAALMCVVLNLFFVLMDLVTYATNTAELMSYIRNSTYQVLNLDEVSGFKRIIGSFVEASSFGYWTLGYFAFATSLWLSGIAPRITSCLSLLSFFALVFSTSSTAYVGLAGYLLVEFLLIAFRFLSRPINPQMMIFVVFLPIIFGIAALFICLNDQLYSNVADLLNTLVFNKMSTSSGIQRSSWNAQGIQNFLDTFGFGVGNGSARASSFPIAVISNLGIVGTMLYAMFLLSIWFNSKETSQPLSLAMQRAARSACFAWLIGATASGGFVDLGLPFFAFAALACAGVAATRTRLSPWRADTGSLATGKATGHYG
jgi:hypothetical protein